MAKLTEKVFDNCIQQCPFAAMERMLVLVWQFGNFIVGNVAAACDIAL